ncbi:MAG TPA: hypothetical protein VD884_00725 [Ohtaekwangia sp.]|nr:hypothetical protein [Ohtaekwangia sp.]
MRKLIIVLFTTTFFNACGQSAKEVVFDSRFQPNSEYITEMESISKSKINFTGPEEKIDNIKASGIELPMIVEGSTSMKTTIQTFDLLPDSTFKVKMGYGNIRSSQLQNGQGTEKDSPISGLIIEGTYNSQNKFKIDTLISDKVDNNTKNTLIYTLENVQDKIAFPDYPMKVGDSFEQELPMNIPVAGISNVGIIIKTKYKLKNISGDLASFEIDQTIELNMDVEQANVSATGSGTGISQFDIAEKFITKYESDLTIELTMNVEDLKMNVEINAISTQNVTIK